MLPLYDYGSKVSPYRANLLPDSATDFIRRADLCVEGRPRQMKLVEALEASDNALAKVANACGAMVIDHEWGLARTRTYDIDLLPPSTTLVAKVPLLRSISKPSEEEVSDLTKIIHSYQVSSQDTWLWDDADPRQFIKQGSNLVIVDIEPRIVRNQNFKLSERFTNMFRTFRFVK